MQREILMGILQIVWSGAFAALLGLYLSERSKRKALEDKLLIEAEISQGLIQERNELLKENDQIRKNQELRKSLN